MGDLDSDYMNDNGARKRQSLFKEHTTLSFQIVDQGLQESNSQGDTSSFRMKDLVSVDEKNESIIIHPDKSLDDKFEFSQREDRQMLPASNYQYDLSNVSVGNDLLLNSQQDKYLQSMNKINMESHLKQDFNSLLIDVRAIQQQIAPLELHIITQIEQDNKQSGRSKNSSFLKRRNSFKHQDSLKEEEQQPTLHSQKFKKFKIGFLVRKFVKKIIKNLERSIFDKMTSKQFSIINDQSFEMEDRNFKRIHLKQMKRNKFINSSISWNQHTTESNQFFLEVFNFNQFWQINQKNVQKNVQISSQCQQYAYLQKIKIYFDQESKFVLTWSIFHLFVVMFSCFESLMQISFEEETVNPMNSLVLVIYLFECLISLNTAIFSQGQIITDRKIIASFFLKKNFFHVIIGIISIILSYYWKYFKLLFLIRWGDVSQIYRDIENKLSIRTKLKNESELLKLGVLIISVAHVVGCLFRYVGLLEINKGKDSTWISNDINQSWISQYITSIYWAVVTMVTLGYGDIVPKTTEEKSFTIVIVLFSCGMFGYCLNQIGSVIISIGKDKQEYNQKMDEIETFIKDNDFQLQLQLKIRKHFEFKYHQDQQNSLETKNILQQMNNQLKYDVSKQLYKQLFLSHSLFRLCFSEQLVDQLCLHVQEKSLLPGEYLYQVEDFPENLYFIQQGQIDISPGKQFSRRILKSQEMKVEVNFNQKGQPVGVHEFICQQPRFTSARSISHTRVAFIPFNQFKEQLQKFPKDLEVYCYMKDKMNLQDQTSGYDIMCEFCNRFDHSFHFCKKYQYIPNMLKEIKSHKQSIQLKRQSFQRTNLKKNSLHNLSNYSLKASQIKELFISKEEQFLDSQDSNISQEAQLLECDMNFTDQFNLLKKQSFKTIVQNQNELLICLILIYSDLELQVAMILYLPSYCKIYYPTKNKYLFYRKNKAFFNEKKIEEQICRKFSKNKTNKCSGQELDIVTEENALMEQSIQKISSKDRPSSLLSPLTGERAQSKKLTSQFKNKVKKLSAVLFEQSQEDKQLELEDPLLSFDQMKEYQIYYPLNNLTSVLKEIIIQKKKKNSKLKQGGNGLGRKSVFQSSRNNENSKNLKKSNQFTSKTSASSNLDQL